MIYCRYCLYKILFLRPAKIIFWKGWTFFEYFNSRQNKFNFNIFSLKNFKSYTCWKTFCFPLAHFALLASLHFPLEVSRSEFREMTYKLLNRRPKEKRNNEDKHNFIAILKTCLEAFIRNWLIFVLDIWKKSKPNQKMALFFLNSFQTKSHSRFTAHLTLTHTRPKNGKHEVPNILLLTLSSCSYWGGTPHFCCQKGHVWDCILP